MEPCGDGAGTVPASWKLGHWLLPISRDELVPTLTGRLWPAAITTPWRAKWMVACTVGATTNTDKSRSPFPGCQRLFSARTIGVCGEFVGGKNSPPQELVQGSRCPLRNCRLTFV